MKKKFRHPLTVVISMASENLLQSASANKPMTVQTSLPGFGGNIVGGASPANGN